MAAAATAVEDMEAADMEAVVTAAEAAASGVVVTGCRTSEPV